MINQILIKLSAVVVDPVKLHIPLGTPEDSLSTILKIVFAVAGAISLVIITVAGLQMVLSQGTPESVNKSRNAVIYAAVGLAVCVSGYTIVTFVLNKL